MHSVFLSHNSKDKEFVRELYRRLKRDGVDCFFDAESIGWGDNWVRALERGLDECSYIVFVLSPDFCNSQWVELERTSSIADDPSGLKRKVRPLMLIPCRDLPTFPRFLKQIQAIDVSTPSLFEANYPKICEALGGVVTNDLEVADLDRTQLPPVRPLPERHRMPYRSLEDKFVGRVHELWHIYDVLHRNSTTILQGVGIVAGTGGLGKSQTAIEYAHRFGAAYRGGVYWVDADRGLGTLISQVSEAAGIVMEKTAEEPAQLQQLWRALNRMPPSLIVLDNFPEDISLRPYLPTTGNVHTLVTTRRRDLIGMPHVLLNVLSLDAGIELLNSGARNLSRDDAAALVGRLGGLPLALELTKSFLNRRIELSVQRLLAAMDAKGEIDVLRQFVSSYRDELPSGHELDVVRTFQMSWDLAPATGKLALRAMAELAPFPVPRNLLRAILNLKEPSGLDDELDESLSELSRLSLIELDSSNNPVMHRLIRSFVRHLNEVDQASPFERAAAVVIQEMAAVFRDPDAATLRYLNLIVPHAEHFASSKRLGDSDSVNLMNYIGKHHRNLGRYATARTFYASALDKAEKTYASGHSSITALQSNLAIVLSDLGQLEEARDLLRLALNPDEQLYLPDHESVITKQSNLGLILRHLWQLEEARDLLKKALESAEKTNKPGSSLITTIQSNLGLALQSLGQLEEARDLFQKALESDKKTHPPGHPTIALKQSNLATVLQELGQLKQAHDLLAAALATDEKTFGPGHPSIAQKQSNLAMVLKDLKEPEKARDLLQNALESAEKAYEPGHPFIALVRSNLGLVLKDLGESEKAVDLLRKALASDMMTYKPGHPSIARTQSNLAIVLRHMGQLQEARDLFEQALASDEKTYKPGHPLVGARRSLLVAVLRDLGQLEEARQLEQRAAAATNQQA